MVFIQFSSVAQLCPTLCDPMDCSTPGLPVHHQLPEFTQTHVHCGEGNGNPLQYSCLENPMDEGAWLATVHGIMKSWTELTDFTFTFYFHALEKEMATLSSIFSWKIPGTEEPGGLLSIGLHRIEHDWHNLAAAAACPLSRWCHQTISSSVVPFSSCPQSLPASESCPMSQLFTSGGKSIGISASISDLPVNTQDWSPLGWTGWISLQSKGFSRVFFNTTVQKHQFFGA